MGSLKWMKLKDKASSEYQLGNFESASQLLKKAIALCPQPENTDLDKILAIYAYSCGEYELAIQHGRQFQKYKPGDFENVKNLICLFLNVGQYQAAASLSEQYVSDAQLLKIDDKTLIDLYSAQAMSKSYLKDFAGAREAGNRAFKILAEQEPSEQGEAIPMKPGPIPPFNPDAPDKNIIAFSLWGNDRRYLDNAVTNVQLAEHIYPEWRCRLYVDSSVPDAYLGKLQVAGAELAFMPAAQRAYDGLFWRFHVVSDPEIDRFLIRDADSLVSVRERAAVCDWLDSDKPFHLMRDSVSHTEPILAGMWGGVAGLLPPLEEFWTKFVHEQWQHKTIDQHFLRYMVWPVIKDHCLAHDAHYTFNGARPFPPHAAIASHRHVGQNNAVHGNKIKCVTPRLNRSDSGFKARECIVFTLTTGRSGTRFLARLFKKNLHDAEVHHERSDVSDFNNHSPEPRHFLQYNNEGITPDLTDFWAKKLLALKYGTTGIYAEVSHFLAKAGLLNYLPLLHESKVHVICLKRDTFETAWSLANHFDFANTEFVRHSYLDPDYKRNLFNSPELKKDMLGCCLWYVLEMRLRTELYKLRFSHLSNTVFHDVDLEDIATNQGAAVFLKQLQIPLKRKLIMPDKQDTAKQRTLDDESRLRLMKLVERFEFDATEAARKIYFNSQK